MNQRGERTWTGLAVAGVILACACAAIGIVGVGWLAPQVNRPPQRTSAAGGRIAYVGGDGHIYTIAPDGSNEHQVTRDRLADTSRYNALAWSLDGQLAFVSFSDAGSALFTSQPDGSDRTLVFSGEADAAPFYLYWSPDSQRIAFLAPSPSDRLTVWMAASHDSDSSQIIARGSPSYFSWAPDGQSVLMHIGGERMAVFRPGQSELTDLPDVPGGFQSPAWSPDGRRFLFVRQADNGTQELVLAEGDERRALASSRAGLAFAWSPRGDRIAFSIPDPADPLLYGSVVVIDPEGKERRVAAQGQILAFFWSPDGERLAVLNLDTSKPSPQGRAIPVQAQAAPAPQSANARLAWSVVNVADGAFVDFPPFYPTDPFLLLVPYFDQYAQSLSLWSPDGRSLVYADVDERGESSIRVLDTQQPQQPARRLSDGTFAAWSWH